MLLTCEIFVNFKCSFAYHRVDHHLHKVDGGNSSDKSTNKPDHGCSEAVHAITNTESGQNGKPTFLFSLDEFQINAANCSGFYGREVVVQLPQVGLLRGLPELALLP
ncbi:hypothetical protein M3P05_11745 [Sansalvadorimonas sp. 2012CJ34-2]|uniref:Uncharacterized protein n=1 Tax=Parendozoicomonas callyspongiae TaxID=2942213 RepID=A0ABT0PGT9_9GAMM|nr:hypothetical protein [Sansalvadorimonas sp. 2012CJ34-2]MCL6270597.1 hypothetical protein [Sansalvadorimonas sp. 2012CJ34-2]